MARHWAMLNSKSQSRNEQFLTNNYWTIGISGWFGRHFHRCSIFKPPRMILSIDEYVHLGWYHQPDLLQCSQFQWFHCHKHGAITAWRVYKFSNPGIPFFCLYDIYWYSAIDITWQVGKSLVNKAVDGRCCLFFLRKTEKQMHCKSWYYKRIMKLLIDARYLLY